LPDDPIDIECFTLARFPALTSLNILPRTEPDHEIVSILQKAQNVTDLELTGASISVLGAMPHISSLRWDCKASVQALNLLRLVSRLEKLSLHLWDWGRDEENVDFGPLKCLRHLRLLKLSVANRKKFYPTLKGFRCVNELPKLSDIRFQLYGCPDEAHLRIYLEILSQIHALTKLVVAHEENDNFLARAFEIVHQLCLRNRENFCSLRELILSHIGYCCPDYDEESEIMFSCVELGMLSRQFCPVLRVRVTKETPGAFWDDL